MNFTNYEATYFANSWIDAWNSRNLEAILSHYTEDFEIITPMAEKILGQNIEKVKGKENVRAYFIKGLEMIPDLNFLLLDVLTGVQSITIYYVNTATDGRAVENLFFNSDGRVYRAVVMYH